ncbi:unnamed protein product, partial [Choristocarpus tenellus]
MGLLILDVRVTGAPPPPSPLNLTSSGVGVAGVGVERDWSRGQHPGSANWPKGREEYTRRNAGERVEIVVGPDDLLALAQACPLLQELIVCGNADPRFSRVRHRMSHRNDPGAHTFSLDAVVPAAASAVAKFLCPSSSLSSKARAVLGNAKGICGDEAQGEHTGGFGHQGGDGKEVDSTSKSSSLRRLTLMDCPDLPPAVILGALGATDGAGLTEVHMGYSQVDRTRAGHAFFRRRSMGATNMLSLYEPISGGRGQEVLSEEEARDWGRLCSRDVEGFEVLRCASLEAMSVLCDDEVMELNLACPMLRKLNVEGCNTLWKMEMEASPLLRDLNLSGCGFDDRMVALTHAVPGLTAIDISGNFYLRDTSVMEILANCPALSSFKMDGSHSSWGHYMLHFILSRQSLMSCHPPQSALVDHTWGQCLSELVLARTGGFSGLHLVGIAVSLPSLRRLSLASCHRLTEVDGAESGGAFGLERDHEDDPGVDGGQEAWSSLISENGKDQGVEIRGEGVQGVSDEKSDVCLKIFSGKEQFEDKLEAISSQKEHFCRGSVGGSSDEGRGSEKEEVLDKGETEGSERYQGECRAGGGGGHHKAKEKKAMVGARQGTKEGKELGWG